MNYFLKRLRKNRRGATAIEYGLILGLIGVACVGAFSAFGSRSSAMWDNIRTNALANL